MIPLRDNIPSRRTPFVNYVIIGLTCGVFLLQLGEGRDEIVERYALVPRRVLQPDEPVRVKELQRVPFFGNRVVTREMASPPISPWITVLTSIFLHGGWLHLLGNMWFLYIFGDNLEDRMGHGGYLLFYLGCGVLAGLAHLFSNTESAVPTVGASGAIAGVMGGYFVLFPHARILTLVPIFFFLQLIVLPAAFFLGIWFLFQFLSGALAERGANAGGIAWWAHIGGFAAGALIVFLLKHSGMLSAAPAPVTGTPRYRRATWRQW